MRPWKVAVGLTTSMAALGVWGLWVAVPSLHPFWRVVLVDHGAYLALAGGVALLSVGTGVYAAARVLGLGAVGRKVDVVERAMRRGAGQDAALAEALARDEAGDYS